MDQRMLKRMMQEAQKSQKILQEKITQFESQTFETKFGADHIKISLKGDLSIESVSVADDLLADKEMLEEVLCDALNEAIQKVKAERIELEQKLMPKTNGLF